MKNALELQCIKVIKGFEMKDMTFSLPEGCILGLVRKNGAGKYYDPSDYGYDSQRQRTIYVLGKRPREDFTETNRILSRSG